MSFRVARRMDGVERTLIRRIFDAAPPGSINLGLGQPDLPTPSRICLAGIDGIVSGKTATRERRAILRLGPRSPRAIPDSR
jgi:aspartate aminotransferase